MKVTCVGALGDGATVVTLPDASVAAVGSDDVEKEKLDNVTAVPAAGFAMPESVIDADVDAAKAHVPPRVTVTTCAFTVSVGVQVPLKPVTDGTIEYVGGSVTVDGNVTAMVDPPLSAPVAEVLKFTVHATPEPASVDESLMLLTVDAVEAVIAAIVVGLAAVPSCDVSTENPDAV